MKPESESDLFRRLNSEVVSTTLLDGQTMSYTITEGLVAMSWNLVLNNQPVYDWTDIQSNDVSLADAMAITIKESSETRAMVGEIVNAWRRATQTTPPPS